MRYFFCSLEIPFLAALFVYYFIASTLQPYTFSFEKKSCTLANLKNLKICAIILTSYFFSPKKVGKKGLGLRKMRGFCFLAPAAPKKLAALLSGDCVPSNPFGSNSFWLHPPPLKQNLHFSKAGLATLGGLYFI
jgi:hypothetical protein